VTPPLTIAAARAALDTGRICARDLLQQSIDRFATWESHVHAFVTPTLEAARHEADAVDVDMAAGRHRGPLHGIPIAIKDIIDAQGVRTTCHSWLRQAHVPSQDATVVARLKQGGAVLLGKLATHEFAFGGPSFDLPFPPARNPWDVSRFTGGSSSGAGAAVAAGVALGALGTDTGGSIRQPAALCGVAGLKPTYGLVSRAGVFPLAWSLDHVGPLAWTAEDCALILNVVAGHDRSDATSHAASVSDFTAQLGRNLRGLRLGVPRAWFLGSVTTEVADATEAALRRFAELGAQVVDVPVAPLADWHASLAIILLAEAFAVHAKDLRTHPSRYGARFRDRVMLGAFLSARDYLDAQRSRLVLTAGLNATLRDVDALVFPAAPGPATRLEANPKWGIVDSAFITGPGNLAGLPSLSVCAGYSAEGLPLGLQIMGRSFDDAGVLALGDAYERATDWRARRPRLALA